MYDGANDRCQGKKEGTLAPHPMPHIPEISLAEAMGGGVQASELDRGREDNRTSRAVLAHPLP